MTREFISVTIRSKLGVQTRLNSTMKKAKYMTPSAATPSQSRPRGHLITPCRALYCAGVYFRSTKIW
jgi:hypothetical protein